MPKQLEFDWEAVSPPKPELLELWTPDDIFEAVLREGISILKRFSEDWRIEYKSARYHPRQLGDDFSMWANTQPHGGIIVVGIENCQGRCGYSAVSAVVMGLVFVWARVPNVGLHRSNRPTDE